MGDISNTLINLDTDDYYNNYKDVQVATKGMNPIDRKLWILNHFIKYGYEEHRKYKLLSHESKCEPEKEKRHHKHKDKKGDVNSMIQQFRSKYGRSDGGARDKKKYPQCN